MRIALAASILSLLLGCGESGPTHWKDQPLEAVTGTVDGVGYTIQLPRGMKQESAESSSYAYHQDGYTFAPRVSVTTRKPRTLDEALADETEPVIDKIDKLTTTDGWAYLTENSSYKGKADYIVEAQVGELACWARIYPMRKRSESEKDVKALWHKVAAMCLSLKRT